MRSAIFITIRKDSSRLPNKAVRKILNSTVMEHIINRAKLAKNFDEVIVCTTTRSIDDEIAEIAERSGAKVYRGSLNDKLDRWNGAAAKYEIDNIVTFDGDDLFCEPKLLELGLKELNEGKFDFLEAPEGLICGAFTYAFTAKALCKVCEIKASDDTEMMWTYFKDTGIFKTGKLKNVPEIYFDDKIRATLDYPEDFEFFTKVFEHFNCTVNNVPLEEIVLYLRNNPEIAMINIGRQQEFLDNQKRKTHLELKENVNV
ncbi:MAG: hypothetical protein IKN12_12735 [Selenomonadaceae bacterium]|nr:hypothetical protein [Selenomonadaceae bacterium]